MYRSKVVIGTLVALASLTLGVGCADILGLDPLGPVTRSEDSDQDIPDASTEASAPVGDASDQ